MIPGPKRFCDLDPTALYWYGHSPRILSSSLKLKPENQEKTSSIKLQEEKKVGHGISGIV